MVRFLLLLLLAAVSLLGTDFFIFDQNHILDSRKQLNVVLQYSCNALSGYTLLAAPLFPMRTP